VSSPSAQNNNEGAAVSLAVSATDSDSDTLSYSATGLPAGLSIDSATGEITGTAGNQAAQTTPYSVTVTATDGFNTASTTFTWTISDATTPAVGNPGDQSSNEGDTVSVTVAATDSDNDTLSYSATGLPAWLSINSATGRITGTAGNQAATTTPYRVTVTATDGFNSGSTTFN